MPCLVAPFGCRSARESQRLAERGGVAADPLPPALRAVGWAPAQLAVLQVSRPAGWAGWAGGRGAGRGGGGPDRWAGGRTGCVAKSLSRALNHLPVA